MKSLALATLILLFLSAACSVETKRGRDGDSDSVDIRTPLGRIQASEKADANDTGLPVYPGARLAKEDDHDHDNATVNLSFGDFGLKVAAVRYESDDTPEKIIAFYKDSLDRYGDVLECHTDRNARNRHGNREKNSDDRELHCDDNGGTVLELKAGTKNNQRIVTIEPKGKMTTFSLVFVRTGSDPI